MPVVTARQTMVATPSGSTGVAPLEVRVDRHRDRCGDGTEVLEGLVQRDVGVCDTESPRETPALVVASALKPSVSRARALPTSQRLGITKHPDECSRWNAAIRVAARAGYGPSVITTSKFLNVTGPSDSSCIFAAYSAVRGSAEFCIATS